jgi:hypothetical protein
VGEKGAFWLKGIATLSLIVYSALAVAWLLSTDTSYPGPPWRQTFFFWSILGAGFLYLVALRVHFRQPKALSVKAVIIVALLMRIPAMLTPPTTSNDYTRYLWDAEVTRQVGSPYLAAPSDDRFAAMHGEPLYGAMHHHDLPGIYPPVAVFSFRVASLISANSPLGLKIVLGMADLLALALLAGMLRRRHPWPDAAPYLMLYAWCPLPIVEVWINAHSDVLALPLLLLFIDAIHRRPILSAVPWALACLVKPLALLLGPAILLQGSWRNVLAFGAIAVAIAIALYAPLFPSEMSFQDGVQALFAGLATYAEHGTFNGSISRALDAVIGWPSRFVTQMLLVAWVLFVWVRIRPAERAMLWVLGGFVLLARTLYPWYLLWLLPFIALRPSRPLILLLGVTIYLSNWVLVGYAQDGSWIESTWVGWLEYTPVYLLLVYELGQRRGRNKVSLLR